MPSYAELQVCSNYSFLRGASRIEELLLQAKVLGLDALAITDHNTLAGIARAHARAAQSWVFVSWWAAGWIFAIACPSWPTRLIVPVTVASAAC